VDRVDRVDRVEAALRQTTPQGSNLNRRG